MSRAAVGQTSGKRRAASVARAEHPKTGPGSSDGITAEVLGKARASGLLGDKDSRITGRISKALVDQAKRRTGITENSRLVEYALASIALEDGFSKAFKSVRGAIEADVDLGL